MIKILHTADWHIGKKLHRTDLQSDHHHFFDWMLKLIKEKEINLLLISGDIFDLANPSSQARKLYYSVLKRLSALNCQVIITGGNHDSPAVLNAPKEILEALDVQVIGGLPTHHEEMILPITNASGDIEIVVAAIPYMRDADLRQMSSGDKYDDRHAAIREGIEAIFTEAAEICKAKFPNVPSIAMGHLYAHGAKSSDSERDIQIGNEAGIEASRFGNYFNYIALGHIHRPQEIAKSGTIFYSGSPIPLSFSERDDKKRMLLLEASINGIENIESISIPSNRKLIRISGSIDKIKSKILKLKEEENSKSKHLVELILTGDTYDPSSVVALDELVSDNQYQNFEIIKRSIKFENTVRGSNELFQLDVKLEDLKPIEVFTKRMEEENLDTKDKDLLLEAFRDILEQLQQEESARS